MSCFYCKYKSSVELLSLIHIYLCLIWLYITFIILTYLLSFIITMYFIFIYSSCFNVHYLKFVYCLLHILLLIIFNMLILSMVYNTCTIRLICITRVLCLSCSLCHYVIISILFNILYLHYWVVYPCLLYTSRCV